MQKKLNINNFFLFSSFIIFITPLILYGLKDIEEYEHGILYLKLLESNNFNPFTFYYDLLGPGTRLPIGHGLFNFPTYLFIKNYQIYFLLTISLCFFIQIYGLKKLLKLLKINNFYLLNFCYLFSIPFFCYSYINDWSLHPYFLVSIFPLTLYLCIKYIEFKKSKTFFKLILLLSIIYLNNAPQSFLTLALFIIILFLLNKELFFLKKKYFYFGAIIFFLCISENIYNLTYEINNYENAPRTIQDSYSLKHFFSGFYLFFSFFESFGIFDFPFINEYEKIDARLPFSNIFFYAALYKSLELIFKKSSKKIYFLNILFIIFFIASFIDDMKILKFISGVWLFRDYYNFLSIILFGYFLIDLKKKIIKKFIIFVSIIFSINFYLQNVNITYQTTKNDYNIIKINKIYNNSKAYSFFEKIQNKDKFKTYLSPYVYRELNSAKKNNKTLIEANIFSRSDLIKYNLYPFTYHFYMSSKNPLRKPYAIMRTEINPEFSEINHPFFFNLFRIKYLLIEESEIKYIKNDRFIKINELQLNNGNKLFLLEKINTDNIILKDKKSIEILNKKKCDKYDIVNCLLDENKLFSTINDVSISRKNLNEYEITNNYIKDERIILLPFLHDKNWKLLNNENIINIRNTFMIIELKSLQKIEIFYQDTLRIILKIISITSIIFLTTYVFLGRIFFINRRKL